MKEPEAHAPLNALLSGLFGAGYRITRQDAVVTGEAAFDGQTVAIVGTADRASIGAREALAMARYVLDVMRDHPGRPILVIADNSGQRLALWDELIGNNGCIAHLGKCLYLARQRGHRVIGIVYDLAVSGGFMATGMAAEACYAVADAELRVMALNAMARITRVAPERLSALSEISPILGPGVGNFERLGAVHGIWSGDLRQHLAEALTAPFAPGDRRRQLGAERNGRKLAAEVAGMVRKGLEA